MSIALRSLRKGRSVEIGCIGAHGRTGTLLAAMLVREEGLSAKQAIAETRLRYCSHAIESQQQEHLIYKFAGETPPPVKKKVYPSLGSYDYLYNKESTSQPSMASLGSRDWDSALDDVMARVRGGGVQPYSMSEDWALAYTSIEDDYGHWSIGDYDIDHPEGLTACGKPLDRQIHVVKDTDLPGVVTCPQCSQWSLEKADEQASCEEIEIIFASRFDQEEVSVVSKPQGLLRGFSGTHWWDGILDKRGGYVTLCGRRFVYAPDIKYSQDATCEMCIAGWEAERRAKMYTTADGSAIGWSGIVILRSAADSLLHEVLERQVRSGWQT